MKISHLILCLFLIAFGCAFGYFLFFIWELSGFFLLLLLKLPTFLLGCVLPVYVGVSYFIDIIRRKGENE